jgi:signal transduction histidine kinase
MELFWKIFIPVLISFVIIISLLSYIVTTYEIADKEESIIKEFQSVGNFVAKEIEISYSESKWPFETLNKLSEREDFLFWWIVDDKGEIHLSDNASFMESNAYDYFPRISQDFFLNPQQNYGFVIKYFKAGEKRWSFWLGFSLKEVSEIQKRIILTNLPLSSSSLLLLGVVLYIIIQYFTKPLSDLTKTTKELEKGNFDVRVNIRTKDELEHFGNTLNKTAEVLKQRDQEHKQLDNAKTNFLSITSHELRSPMTPMKAQLQMLLGQYFGKLTKKQKESIEIVLRNTIRLDKIIEDFLEISRIEAARLKFRFIKTNLAEHINRLAEEMEGFMPEKNIKIITNTEKLPVIEADPDRVMQVLRNLINNAKKFSPENTKLFINAELKNNMIEFGVKDQGIGISLENQIRLFEPFFQAEQTIYREHAGAGLGLAICKGIVESQNGRMWFESEEGKGSTFYFTVPLKPVREMKPIKVLFSEHEDIKRKIKNLFIEYLGPLGEHEFEALNRQAIIYKTAKKYIDDLYKKGIINQDTLDKIDKELLYLFEVKKTINVLEAIKRKYLEVLGPLGNRRVERIGKLTASKILEDINSLEKNRIINAAEASEFRDYIMGLFRQKEIEGKEYVSSENLAQSRIIKTK